MGAESLLDLADYDYSEELPKGLRDGYAARLVLWWSDNATWRASVFLIGLALSASATIRGWPRREGGRRTPPTP